nr:type II secretion system F family protein [Sinomonas gamaensis]
MSAGTSAAFACGAILGLGLWIIMVRIPPMRLPSFADRVAPQLRAVDASSRLLRPERQTLTPLGPLEWILLPLLHDAMRRLPGLSHVALAKRLANAGSRKGPLEFRSEQLIWSAVGFATATVAGVSLSASGRLSPWGSASLVVLSTAVVFVGREMLLVAAIRRRRQRILAEFPSIADMMALAVSAGESASGSLERTASLSKGALAAEFALVLADIRSGVALARALQLMDERIGLTPISRFVDGLVVAIERGTPLAEVLRAQAQDVRDLAKRELMEAAGRKEIGMMVPLVFGILPLTIVFAVYPAVAAVTLTF